jgi:O-acetyl-ADP-ribose deacetylase (regulator of RNase III)
MTERTRLFVCYKKKGVDGRENNAAYQLYQFLNEVAEYDVWMDEGLDAGVLWEKTIYESLLSCEVVILALGDGTSQSEWVRREISIAMAFGIQVVPVGLNISEEDLHRELQNLGLTGIHYRRPFNIASLTARGIVSELRSAINRARENTKLGGHELLGKILKKVEPVTQRARPNLTAASKILTVGTKKLSVHIAAGDIFRLSNYDILVNSENDYMQMARIFDTTSISAQIRHYGSSTEKGYLEDTIQSEIEDVVAGRPRPVPAGTAIVTSSGGPSSLLYRNNKVSHVVHVASVQAVLAEHRIAPLTGEAQIRACVSAALEAAQSICQNKGIVSPKTSRQHEIQQEAAQRFAPRRLVLPLFGTGRGGQSPVKVGPIMLEAILDFFSGPRYEEQYMPLTDIHLSVLSQDDVGIMSDALAKADVKLQLYST